MSTISILLTLLLLTSLTATHILTSPILQDTEINLQTVKDKKFKNGDVYSGDIKKSLMGGTGKMVYHNKDVYSGSWADGAKSGDGTYTWSNGDVYTGGFQLVKICRINRKFRTAKEDRANWSMVMEISMRERLRVIWGMGPEKWPGSSPRVSMKVIGRAIKWRGREKWAGPMAVGIPGSGRIIKWKDRANLRGWMAGCILEHRKGGLPMGKGFSSMRKVPSMRGYLSKG
jgi:hypothetical protein